MLHYFHQVILSRHYYSRWALIRQALSQCRTLILMTLPSRLPRPLLPCVQHPWLKSIQSGVSRSKWYLSPLQTPSGSLSRAGGDWESTEDLDQSWDVGYIQLVCLKVCVRLVGKLLSMFLKLLLPLDLHWGDGRSLSYRSPRALNLEVQSSGSREIIREGAT